MNKLNIFILFSAVVLTLSATAVVVYQQLEISRLYNQNQALSASKSMKDQEISSLRTTNYEQLRKLNESYNERIANMSLSCNQLNASYYEALRALQQATNSLNSSGPELQFDKNVYFTDVEVFWKPIVYVPIAVRVLDPNVKLSLINITVSSSIDSKEVTLAKNAFGIFAGTMHAVVLRLDELISDKDSLNVRYGDFIIAKYRNTRGHLSMASAFFAFPKYVSQGLFVDPNIWKSLDKEGVPIVDYGGAIGVQYNPVTVSQYALALYHAYLDTENTTLREKFLLQANWLVTNAKQKGNFSVWEYNFNWTKYKVTAPWVSAMAQGQGLSVLTRAYVLTGNTTYLDVAETAMKSFEVEMNASGVRYTDSSGIWYEEYADVNAPSSKVLNGFIIALLGLYEYSFLTNSTSGYELFSEGTLTLSVNLYRYDSGSWSHYDLIFNSTASLGYHKLHIDLLKTMHKITGIDVFLQYSDRFQSYIH